MKVGDHVVVVADVWDDNRNRSWLGWRGIVRALENDSIPHDPYQVFVFFPKARGKWRFYDFAPHELAVVEK